MKKRLLSWILVLTLLCGLIPICSVSANATSDIEVAYAVEGGNIYFDKETGAVTDCDGTVTSADIPAEIEGVAVTQIGDYAFYYCDGLTSVNIPDSVAFILDWAFAYCDSLTSVNIPDSVTCISQSAFNHCISLTGIWVDGANETYSSDEYGILFIKDKTRLIKCPDGYSGSYTIPDGVTKIDWYAFQYCISLTDVTIPDSVTDIGGGALASCSSLAGIWVDAASNSYSSDESGVLFNKDKTELIQCPGGYSGSYTIPDSVTEIRYYAFSGCTSLTDVTIPDSVTEIGHEAFSGCTSLTDVTISDSVTDIDNHTFYDCTGLTSVTIPDSVISIGVYAFSHCTSLTSVNIADSVTSIGDKAFSGCTSLTDVTIPDSVTDISYEAFFNCTSLVNVYFLGHAPELGFAAFMYYNDHGDWASMENIPDLILYFVEGKEGWTRPEWNGYPTATWDGVNPPHRHEYESIVTEPTCTELGYTTYTCECGDSYVADYVDALGHAYADGACTRCGKEDPDYVPEVPPVEFSDVSDSAWYAEAVDYAVNNALMNGTGNNKFEPESSMTRAMLVTVLWRYAGEPLEGENAFVDVPNDQWYAQAVTWAAHNAVVLGVGESKFDPDGTITREQMAAILYRYANMLGIDTGARADLDSFPDSGEVSSYATDAVRWAVAEGLLNGSDGKLLPQGKATRAQVATILMRFIENVVK